MQFPFNQFVEDESPKKLLQFMKDSMEKTETWPQVKLITIGDGGVGKVEMMLGITF